MSKLTSLSFTSGVTGNDLIHIVITGDTSQSSEGSSYKASLSQLKSVFPDVYVTGGTYSNGTAVFTNTTGGTFNVTGFTTNIIDITYSDLVSLITGSNLILGGLYRLTDFQTIYDQPDYDSLGNPKISVSTLSGSVEPLLVRAISNNEISNRVLSTIYENDQLLYDWSFQVTEVMGVSAKGRITERITSENNRTPYDSREVLFKRYETINGSGIYDSYIDTGFNSDSSIATFQSNSGNNYLGDYTPETPYTFILSNNVFGDECYNNALGVQLFNNTFGIECQNNKILNYCYNNKISDYFKNNEIGNQFSDNNIDYDFINNRIKDFFQNNIISYSFSNNHIGSYFGTDGATSYPNTISDGFIDNIINNYFYDNVISSGFQLNKITGNFISNSIGLNAYNNSCVYFDSNVIGDSFEYNVLNGIVSNITAGDNFKYNVITNTFTGHIIVNNFQQNLIETQIPVNTNFSLATRVYGVYNCRIFRGTTNNYVLSYYTAASGQLYTTITA